MALIELSNGNGHAAAPQIDPAEFVVRTPAAHPAGHKARAAQKPAGRLVVRTFSTVAPEQLAWLWKWRLAFGKLAVLDGPPDVGKSTIQIDLAARVSRGTPMPDGSSGLGRPADVLILAAAEDGAADTIRPRLEAAGADMSRVHLVDFVMEAGDDERMLEFPRDLPLVRELVDNLGVRLILVDALMALVPDSTNSNSDPSMRRLMHPLAKLAEETGAAILLNRHFTKRGGDRAVNRGGGSIAVIGVARTGLAAVRDPDDESGERRLLMVTKCNIAPEREKRSAVYRIVSAQIPDASGAAIETSRVEWMGTDARRADDVLVAVEGEDRDPSGVDEAVEIIRSVMGDGEWHDQKEVKEVAQREDIGSKTLRTARERLERTKELERKREGSGKNHRSLWRLATPVSLVPSVGARVNTEALVPDRPTSRDPLGEAVSDSADLSGALTHAGIQEVGTSEEIEVLEDLGVADDGETTFHIARGL